MTQVDAQLEATDQREEATKMSLVSRRRRRPDIEARFLNPIAGLNTRTNLICLVFLTTALLQVSTSPSVEAKIHHSKRQAPVIQPQPQQAATKSASQSTGRENTNWWNLWWQQYINEAVQPTVRPVVAVSFNGQTINLSPDESSTGESDNLNNISPDAHQQPPLTQVPNNQNQSTTTGERVTGASNGSIGGQKGGRDDENLVPQQPEGVEKSRILSVGNQRQQQQQVILAQRKSSQQQTNWNQVKPTMIQPAMVSTSGRSNRQVNAMLPAQSPQRPAQQQVTEDDVQQQIRVAQIPMGIQMRRPSEQTTMSNRQATGQLRPQQQPAQPNQSNRMPPLTFNLEDLSRFEQQQQQNQMIDYSEELEPDQLENGVAGNLPGGGGAGSMDDELSNRIPVDSSSSSMMLPERPQTKPPQSSGGRSTQPQTPGARGQGPQTTTTTSATSTRQQPPATKQTTGKPPTSRTSTSGQRPSPPAMSTVAAPTTTTTTAAATTTTTVQPTATTGDESQFVGRNEASQPADAPTTRQQTTTTSSPMNANADMNTDETPISIGEAGTTATQQPPATGRPATSNRQQPTTSTTSPASTGGRSPATSATQGNRVELKNGKPATGFREQQATTTSARLPTKPTTMLPKTTNQATSAPTTTASTATQASGTTTLTPPTTTTLTPAAARGESETQNASSSTDKTAPKSDTNQTPTSTLGPTTTTTTRSQQTGTQSGSGQQQVAMTSTPATNMSDSMTTTTTSDTDNSADDEDDSEGESEDNSAANGSPGDSSDSESESDSETEDSDSREPTTTSSPLTSTSQQATTPASSSMTTNAKLQQLAGGAMTTTQAPASTTIDIERLPSRGSIRDSSGPTITSRPSTSTSSVPTSIGGGGDFARLRPMDSPTTSSNLMPGGQPNFVMMTLDPSRTSLDGGETAITVPMDTLMKMVMNQIAQDEQRGNSITSTSSMMMTTQPAGRMTTSPASTTQPPTTAAAQRQTSGKQSDRLTEPTSTSASELMRSSTLGGTSSSSGEPTSTSTTRKKLQPPPTTQTPDARMSMMMLTSTSATSAPPTSSNRPEDSAGRTTAAPQTTRLAQQPDSNNRVTTTSTNVFNTRPSTSSAADEDSPMRTSGANNDNANTMVGEPKIELINMDLMPIQRLMGAADDKLDQMTQTNARQQQQQQPTQDVVFDQNVRPQDQSMSSMGSMSLQVEPGMRLRPSPTTQQQQVGGSLNMMTTQQQPTGGLRMVPTSGINEPNTVYMLMMNGPATEAHSKRPGGSTIPMMTIGGGTRDQQQTAMKMQQQQQQQQRANQQQQPARANPMTTTTSSSTSKSQQQTSTSRVPMRVTPMQMVFTSSQRQTTLAPTSTSEAKSMRVADQSTGFEPAREQRPTGSSADMMDGGNSSSSIVDDSPTRLTAAPTATTTAASRTSTEPTTTQQPTSSSMAATTSKSPMSFSDQSMSPASEGLAADITPASNATTTRRPTQLGGQESNELVTPAPPGGQSGMDQSERITQVGGGRQPTGTKSSQLSRQKTQLAGNSSFIPSKLRSDFNKFNQAAKLQQAANATAIAPQQLDMGAAIRQFGGANRMSLMANKPVAFGRPAAATMQQAGQSVGAGKLMRQSARVELPTLEYGPAIAVRRPDEPLANGQAPNCTLRGKNFCVLTKDYPMNEVRQAVERSFRSVRIMYEELQTVSDQELHKDDFNATNNQAASGKFACQTQVEMMRPGWAKDEITKEWMLVVNTDVFPQRVRTESCAQPNTPCEFIAPFYDSTCQQRYSLHRMIAIDLHDPSRSPQVAVFKFPAGCVCRVHPIRKTSLTMMTTTTSSTTSTTASSPLGSASRRR